MLYSRRLWFGEELGVALFRQVSCSNVTGHTVAQHAWKACCGFLQHVRYGFRTLYVSCSRPRWFEEALGVALFRQVFTFQSNRAYRCATRVECMLRLSSTRTLLWIQGHSGGLLTTARFNAAKEQKQS